MNEWMNARDLSKCKIWMNAKLVSHLEYHCVDRITVIDFNLIIFLSFKKQKVIFFVVVVVEKIQATIHWAAFIVIEIERSCNCSAKTYATPYCTCVKYEGKKITDKPVIYNCLRLVVCNYTELWSQFIIARISWEHFMRKNTIIIPLISRNDEFSLHIFFAFI